YTPVANATASLTTNGTYTMSLSGTSCSMYFSVWLDANQDGVFQGGEQLISNLYACSSNSTSITIPASALLEQTRMRVRMDYGNNVNDPCNPLYYGETEDYTVTITCGKLIIASAGSNGSVSPSGTTLVNCGNDQGYTIIPDVNYIVSDVLVDGSSVG